MKHIVLYFLLLLTFNIIVSCNDDLDSISVIIENINEENDFDRWLDENFRAAYNIQFKYKYEDIESDLTYDLVPAGIFQSQLLAKMVKYLWLEPYTEVAGLSFMRTYPPRVFHVIGTVGWNNNNTYTLGTAEGGLKITLYAGNWLSDWFIIETDSISAAEYVIDIDIDNINYYYLHTIHHEFGHILNQTKDYPSDFRQITSGLYAASWQDYSDTQALGLGFISAYARSSVDEDFVETLSFYITLSDTQWQERLSTAGSEGAIIINKKLEYVKNYMKNSWDIDLEQLRSTLSRRYSEVYDIDWINF